ncbi:hypothetical protein [Devosia sp.]|uniref:hypothetical protein n=1 Tax=Devosia sp. TaxID=1871048 RepID=UPI0032659FCC
MSPIHNHDAVVSQDSNFDDGADQAGIAQPFSQNEIDELLYGDDRPAAERLELLRDYRAELAARESGNFGGEDPAALLAEIDKAIGALSTDEDNANDTDDFAGLAAPLDRDPLEHRETLSPDDDAFELLDEEDVEDDLEVLDETEWDDGDDFKPERGTH